MKASEVILATGVAATARALVILLPGRKVQLPWVSIPGKLRQAAWVERKRMELSPGGYGVHWPLLDEDLSVAGLVRLAETGESWPARRFARPAVGRKVAR